MTASDGHKQKKKMKKMKRRRKIRWLMANNEVDTLWLSIVVLVAVAVGFGDRIRLDAAARSC